MNKATAVFAGMACLSAGAWLWSSLSESRAAIWAIMQANPEGTMFSFSILGMVASILWQEMTS